jgi:hypothetical protein
MASFDTCCRRERRGDVTPRLLPTAAHYWSALLLIFAVGAVLVSPQPAFAVRLVRFSVSIDGKVVLETSTADHGEDADTTWRHLKHLYLRPVKGYRVHSDDGPLRATLKGKVIIQADAGGRAEVTELQLVRDKEDAPWKIAPAEVERTLQSRHKPFIFVVLIDGTPQLSTGLQARIGDVPDNADNVWRHLEQAHLVPISRYKIVPDTDDPLQATLRGNVIIAVKYSGKSEERAEVAQLRLVRDKVNAPWKVAPVDIERTFRVRKDPARHTDR